MSLCLPQQQVEMQVCECCGLRRCLKESYFVLAAGMIIMKEQLEL